MLRCLMLTSDGTHNDHYAFNIQANPASLQLARVQSRRVNVYTRQVPLVA